MLLDLYRQAAKTFKWGHPAAKAFGHVLANSSLFPLEHCFQVTESSAIKTSLVTPDQAGILLVINDLFYRHAALFGDAANRQAIINDIQSHIRDGHTKSDFMERVAETFNKRCPDALRDKEIVLVGMDDPKYLTKYMQPDWAVFSPGTKKLLHLFKSVHDFNPARKDPNLHWDNIISKNRGEFGGKETRSLFAKSPVDYVVFANVTNDPSIIHTQGLFPDASAILKRGGSTIALLGYSSDNQGQYVSNYYMQLVCGQTSVAQYNPGGNGYHFVMFDQTSPSQVDAECYDRFHELGYVVWRRYEGEDIVVVQDPLSRMDTPQAEQLVKDTIMGTLVPTTRPARKAAAAAAAKRDIA